MATYSLCMIVKNEERVLRRCLDSISDLVDEIVIVDTGSTDNTKSIAAEYTDKIFDFKWVNDFSAARNFSFSKCNMDYIYVADADEYLDEENRKQFKILKDNIYPEIEIVQMMYETITNDTVLNIYREYRPKLYKRLRSFTWIDPIHETVRLDPLVFDSDIVVTHAPEANHSKRDFTIFEEALKRDGVLSENVAHMYAVELYKNGDISDLKNAYEFFYGLIDFDDERISLEASIVVAKGLRVMNNFDCHTSFEEFINSNDNSITKASELYFEKGLYYLEKCQYDEASECFRNAVYNSTPVLDVHSGGDGALSKLIECCEATIKQYEEYVELNGTDEKMESLITEYQNLIKKYQIDLSNWKMPEEERK